MSPLDLPWLQDEGMCQHHYQHSSSSFSEYRKDRHIHHNKTASEHLADPLPPRHRRTGHLLPCLLKKNIEHCKITYMYIIPKRAYECVVDLKRPNTKDQSGKWYTNFSAPPIHIVANVAQYRSANLPNTLCFEYL